MKIDDILTFEPIDLTQIIVYIIIIAVLMVFFRAQLTSFFESLRTRPITVTMDGSETSIKLDAPVDPQSVTTDFTDPTVTSDENQHWGENLEYIENIEGLEKLGFQELSRGLQSLEENEIAVLNYRVNDPSRYYFKDKNMLKYLSIASEKIRYLAFYDGNRFKGYIKIEKVIKGLASDDYEFRDFGEKLKDDRWKSLPGLTMSNEAFRSVPSIKELYDRLESSGLNEIALLERGKLKSILTYETVSNALYNQTKSG